MTSNYPLIIAVRMPVCLLSCYSIVACIIIIEI